MGEAKLRQPEIDAIKAQAEQDAASVQQLAHFTADAATFVNGVFVTVLENGTVRVTFHEAVHRALPPKPRAALMMTAQTAKNVAEILGRIVKAIDEQKAEEAPDDEKLSDALAYTKAKVGSMNIAGVELGLKLPDDVV